MCCYKEYAAMIELGIVTNASYISSTTLKQLDRLQEECIQRGIKPIKVQNRLPWKGDNISFLPKTCIYLDKDINFAVKLEKSGVRIFNSADSIRLADNKILMQIALDGVVVFPKTLFAPKRYFGEPLTEELVAVEQELGYPLIVKEAFGSLGKQVYIVHDRDELMAIAHDIGAKEHLYQECVRQSSGRSVRLYVVGNTVVGAARYINNNDFRSNLEAGGIAELVSPNDNHIEAALNATHVLGLDFGAVDFFDTDTPMLIEVNSNAYYRGFEAAGINITAKILDYIESKIG